MAIPGTSALTSPSIANTVVAMPRQNAAALYLDDLTGYNPLVRKEDNPDLEPYYKDFNIIKALQYAGAEKPIKQLVYRNYEEGPWFGVAIPGGVVGVTPANTTGGTVQMTLTNGSFSPRRTNTSTGTVALYSPLQKNDYIRTYNGIAALVTAESGTQGTTGITYTVGRGDASNANLAAALQYHVDNLIPLSITSNAFAEGSLQPLKGLERENFYYQNNVQTIKTHRASTGDADVVEVIDVNGVTRIGAKQMLEMKDEHEIKCLLAGWWGQGETYQDQTESLPLVRVTKGVDQSIKERGSTYNFSIAAGFMVADGDAILAQFEATRGGNEAMIFAGGDSYNAWQEYFRLKVVGQPAANYTFNSFGKTNGKEKAADIGFITVIIRGITLHLVRGDMFNIQGITDIAGYGYSWMSYIIPGDPQTVQGDFMDISNGKSATSVQIPALTLLYTTNIKNEMRKHKYWDRPVEITNRDQTDKELLTQMGVRLTYGRKFMAVIGR